MKPGRFTREAPCQITLLKFRTGLWTILHSDR
jgi:hypothetical protein